MKPLPSCGVSLTTLLFPPPMVALCAHDCARQVSPLGKDVVERGYDQSKNGRAQFSANAYATRIKTYRPVMIGQGWMSANQIAQAVGIIPDSVRQRMEKLIESGEVQDRKLSANTRQFRWIGA